LHSGGWEWRLGTVELGSMDIAPREYQKLNAEICAFWVAEDMGRSQK